MMIQASAALENGTVIHSVIWRPMRWLIGGELFLFMLTVPLAIGRYFPASDDDMPNRLGDDMLAGLVFALVMVLILHALGMHVIRTRHKTSQDLLKYLGALAMGFGVLWILLRVSSDIPQVPVDRLAFSLLSGFAGIVLWRSLINTLIESKVMRHRILVYGAGQRAGLLFDVMRRQSDRRGIELIGFLRSHSDVQVSIPGKRQVHAAGKIRDFCRRHRVDEIVTAFDEPPDDALMVELVECRFHGVLVNDAASFVEREFGKIPVDLIDPDWWLDRGGFSESRIRDFGKRTFDMFTSILLLLVAFPLLLACALAIKFEDGWSSSVLFRQQRIGHSGKPFELFKFRSMREDAESDGIARWAVENDSRVTRIGNFIRKTRLDELPQLFNVLRGDMSLVGPRPERPEFTQRLNREIPYYNQRHFVRPGITGWAQLSYPYGASVKDALEKLKYDLYYTKNRNLWFDIMILTRTVDVVLFGKGAR
jgi:sugar transferase (PEP-CTERM system associated)